MRVRYLLQSEKEWRLYKNINRTLLEAREILTSRHLSKKEFYVKTKLSFQYDNIES